MPLRWKRLRDRPVLGAPPAAMTAPVSAASDAAADAEALFGRFAARHGFRYRAVDAPMEVCWEFPAQPGLSLPLTLGLQNEDELNFGVGDFWSYFFPFDRVAERFDRILDLWVGGEARVAVLGPLARTLQVREGRRWKAVYHANRFLPIWRPALRTYRNEPGA